MLRIRYRHGWSFHTLNTNTQGETVSVLRNTGELGYIAWHGFLDLAQAKSWPGARPVQTVIDMYALAGSDTWYTVEPGEFLQGCLISAVDWPWSFAVFRVTVDGAPRLVGPSPKIPLGFQHRVPGRTLS